MIEWLVPAAFTVRAWVRSLLGELRSSKPKGKAKKKKKKKLRGFGDLAGEEFACNAGDPGLILGSGRSPGEANGYPLQYSCLENSMDRGVWWATVCGVAKIQT